jgi:hypothetical protein
MITEKWPEYIERYFVARFKSGGFTANMHRGQVQIDVEDDIIDLRAIMSYHLAELLLL